MAGSDSEVGADAASTGGGETQYTLNKYKRPIRLFGPIPWCWMAPVPNTYNLRYETESPRSSSASSSPAVSAILGSSWP